MRTTIYILAIALSAFLAAQAFSCNEDREGWAWVVAAGYATSLFFGHLALKAERDRK